MLHGATTHESQHQYHSNSGKKGFIYVVHLTLPYIELVIGDFSFYRPHAIFSIFIIRLQSYLHCHICH